MVLEYERPRPKPTDLRIPKGTHVYFNALKSELALPNRDDWHGLVCTTDPVSTRYATQVPTEIRELTTFEETNHLRTDLKPTIDEIDRIISSVAKIGKSDDIKNGLFEKMSGASGEDIARIIANELVKPESIDFKKAESLFAKRTEATQKVLSAAGYQGTAQIDSQNNTMVVAFFDPQVTIRT